jgi:plasmid stability protein
MAALTIRNLDEETKQALRLRAAKHGISMEQEVRSILRKEILSEGSASATGSGETWYRSIRKLVESHGGFELEIPARSKMMREPPTFE